MVVEMGGGCLRRIELKGKEVKRKRGMVRYMEWVHGGGKVWGDDEGWQGGRERGG